MKLVGISKNQLNRFVGGQNFSQFLQSWEWGEFQEKSGFEILRLGAEKEGGLVGAATLIKKKLGMGKSYFYCPRGPIVRKTDNRKQIIEIIFGEIGKIAKKKKVVFYVLNLE